MTSSVPGIEGYTADKARCQAGRMVHRVVTLAANLSS